MSFYLAMQMTPIYDSDPGFGGELSNRRKFKFWKVLKRILHLPSVNKPRSPRTGAAAGTPRKNNRSSFGLLSIRRFSQGLYHSWPLADAANGNSREDKPARQLGLCISTAMQF